MTWVKNTEVNDNKTIKLFAHTGKGTTFANVKIEQRIIIKKGKRIMTTMFVLMAIVVATFGLATSVGTTIDMKGRK